jgi:hypothetical protein
VRREAHGHTDTPVLPFPSLTRPGAPSLSEWSLTIPGGVSSSLSAPFFAPFFGPAPFFVAAAAAGP